MMYSLIDKAGPFDAVVLADGEFPSAEAPLRLLHEAPRIVCCDGAVRHLITNASQMSPVYREKELAVIGDGDSVPDEWKDHLIRIEEQEDNDLTKATRYCLSKRLHNIAYLGTTGKREDHTLGNVSLIVRYFREMGVKPLMATDFGWFVPVEGDAAFASFPGQQVSLFNVSCRRLSSEGLRWDVYPYRQLWQGTLNEAIGDSFSIAADGCHLVYRTYSPKQ